MLETLLFLGVIVLICYVVDLRRRVDVLEGRRKPASYEAPRTPASAQPQPVSIRNFEPQGFEYTAPAITAPAKSTTEKPAAKNETELTGKGLAIVGVLALLFGIGFFLKYAFDHNLIDQAQRVILGLIVGVAFLFLGDFLSFRQKYREYSFFISGGGLAILYLSIYAAFGYYHLIEQPLAFIAMIVVSVIGTGVALRSNSVHLAALALAGGFLAPRLVSSEVNNQVALLGYLVILDLVFLALLYFKRWTSLFPIVFIGTYGVFFSWYSVFYTKAQLWPTVGFLTIYFLIFLIAPLLQSFRRKSLSDPWEIVLIHLNALIYFVTSYLLLQTSKLASVEGMFFGAWAVIFLGLAAILHLQNKEDKFGVGGLLGIGLILATLVIPIQLDAAWVVMAWALEALLLAILGSALNSRLTRLFSYLVSIVTVLSLLARFDNLARGAVAFWNDRFFNYLVVAAALFGISYVLDRFKEKILEDEKGLRAAYFVAPMLLLLYVFYKEINQFRFEQVWITFSWMIAILIFCAAGFLMRSRNTRIVGLALYILTMLRLLVVEQFGYEKAIPIFNPRFGIFVLGVLLSYCLGYLYLRRQADVREEEHWIPSAFGVVANLVTIWALSLEVVNYFHNLPPAPNIDSQMNLSLSIFWGLYSGILMFIGIVGKFRAIRVISLIGIGIVILKVFLYDAAQLEDLYRIISFITLGVILLVTSFIFYKHREQIKEFILA